ncbi:MAG TPA: GNAT family N-acetyltransferase [Solirubrobacterales bacterium]|nr:GNAT family N-acetyltransferase [Solirubrobacterales bacterium]
MADVEVRSARIAEADAVLACYEWLFAPPGSQPASWNPDWAKVALVDAIDSDAANVLVADEGGRISGFCTAYLDLLSVRYGLRCWVEDLAVDPERRSRGIGAALLAAAREWAAVNGASHLELDSAASRVDAHRFYAREGARDPSYSFGWYGLGEREEP